MRKLRCCINILPICLLMVLLCSGMAVRAEHTMPTVKVGYFQMDGYNEIGEDGIYSGYDYEFFQLLGRYSSLNFEFVGYDKSWQEMQEMLQNGEIDILTSMHMTDERREQYDFSYDIGSSYTMLTIKTGNNTLQSGDYASYDGMTVGMIRESSQNTVFEQFAQENGFSYTPVYFESVADLTDAVAQERVDAAVTSSLRQLSGERVIEEINTSMFYAVVRKGQQELLDEIDQGIMQMDLYEGDWRNNLYYKYYGNWGSSDTEIVYSEREQSVISAYSGDGQVLRVCFEPSLPPYSYVEDGEMKGFLPEAVGQIMDSWGINYEYVITNTYEEYQKVYQNGEADIFPEVVSDTSAAAQQQYFFTESYFTMRVGALTKKSSYRASDVIGTVNNQSFFENLTIPNASVVTYDSIEQLLNALEDGKVNLAYLMNYTAQMYVNQDMVGDLIYISVSSLGYDISFAVNKETPHEFCSIFNKNISALAAMDLNTMSFAYIGDNWNDLSFIEYMQIHPWTAFVLFLLVLVMVIVIMVLVFANVQKARVNRINAEREAEREKQQKELHAALLSAENANKAKTVFLSNMSHDIRTPMNAIIGFSALAAKYIDNKEQVRDYLEKISAAGSHLLSLINDVLDMSRIERGKVQLYETSCSLRELIQNLCNMVSTDLKNADLEFISEIHDVADDAVICDQLRLNQILLNLLSNAIKFTKPGGKVKLSLTERPGNDPETAIYEFRVADTGIGMNEQFIEHVFEPFERERNSTVSGIQGTGLGMSISKNIVEMMGGTITVSSQEGKGTEFTVILPMKKASPDLLAAAENSSDTSIEKADSGADSVKIQGKRILLVEDNELNREIAVDILTDAGLQVEEAEDGSVAVEMLLEKGAGYYQLVIMDVQMPVMDGYTAARTIRSFADRELAAIPIIAMTANAFEEDKQKALEAGMNAHMAKPIDPELLLDTLEQILGS